MANGKFKKTATDNVLGLYIHGVCMPVRLKKKLAKTLFSLISKWMDIPWPVELTLQKLEVKYLTVSLKSKLTWKAGTY